jgi:hypothetical protein
MTAAIAIPRPANEVIKAVMRAKNGRPEGVSVTATAPIKER